MDLFESRAEDKYLPGGSSVFLGTSGYSFPDWKGVFYPGRISGKDWLRYYALQFNSVEINSTYYGIPSVKTAERMVNSTPEGFSFSVKLHSSMTHSRDAEKAQWRGYLDMLQPFRESGKLGMILAQFPWSFPLEEKSFNWLRNLEEQMQGYRLAIEFRHIKWYGDEPLERIGKMGFTPVSLDLPDLKGLPGSEEVLSGENVYLRLHGRNAGKWWGNTQERYDYLYNERELIPWVEKLRSLSAEAKKCYVFFNNCHMGKAALNAQDMERLLFGSGDTG